ncbi:MAG: SAM-dependent methyltransferase [Rhodospirillaceae bacterium]|jgi:methyltransferase (TIGR00027 family)|nr:SAM-dependent methyltransferase [Rhodospirillaceae bacterium]
MHKGNPSRTASKIAIAIITLGAKPETAEILPPGIVPATEALLLASGLAGPRAIRWSKSQLVISVYEAFDWMLPGQFEAIADRKAFCERQVRDGIGAGATQILILGAGYDTIGWRLAPEFPDVNFFEIDHPATARLKAKGIVAMEKRENHFLIAEDLGKQTVVDTLDRNKAWDRQARSVIVAEGLVMYLSSDAVRGLFSQCSAVTGIGSRIAFSYIPTGADGRPNVGRWTGLMLWLQKLIEEPWLWSIYPEKLGPFLDETGWRLDPATAEEAKKYGIEYYAVAKK